jgi:hypothetical protein
MGPPGADAAVDAGIDATFDAAADAPPDGGAGCPAASTFDPSMAGEITVPGDAPAMGIFDPSLVYPPDAGTGVMAYSAVPDQETIRTHVAVSSDYGATWTLAAEVNTPEASTIPSSDAVECPGGSCSGNLISEVPSIVLDADEPDSTKVWKLFAHRYLVGPNVALHYSIGTIALQTAPAPGGPWTPPQKLLGWTSPASYSSTGITTNVGSLPGTSDCVVITEPGALWRPGSIDLAVGCVYKNGSALTTRIELLRSTTHGASWESVGTLARPADASCVAGATGIDAADLFVSGGVEYLSATPGDSTGAYEGCLVFRVSDPAAGTIARDATGRAVVARAIAPAPMQFSGACTFADSAGGYALDVGFFAPSIQRRFRILRPGFASP